MSKIIDPLDVVERTDRVRSAPIRSLALPVDKTVVLRFVAKAVETVRRHLFETDDGEERSYYGCGERCVLCAGNYRVQIVKGVVVYDVYHEQAAALLLRSDDNLLPQVEALQAHVMRTGQAVKIYRVDATTCRLELLPAGQQAGAIEAQISALQLAVAAGDVSALEAVQAADAVHLVRSSRTLRNRLRLYCPEHPALHAAFDEEG